MNIGDIVKLVSKPDGYTSKDYKLSVGSQYEVLAIEGCCIWTTTDVVGERACYNRDRVVREQT